MKVQSFNFPIYVYNLYKFHSYSEATNFAVSGLLQLDGVTRPDLKTSALGVGASKMPKRAGSNRGI